MFVVKFFGTLILVCLAIIIYVALALHTPCKYTEIQRITSPSQSICAIVIEDDCGGTTDFGYSIRLSSCRENASSREIAHLYGPSRGNGSSGVDVRWASDSELNIKYESVKIIKYNNERMDEGASTVKLITTNVLDDQHEERFFDMPPSNK